MTDFSRILAFAEGGQRQSFEGLVCHLALLEAIPNACFRRVEGSGGDGGVEAYWMLESGNIIGYQAKFFTRCGDIDWGQIDKSVKQALTTHPNIERYYIAIACDLTDKAGVKRRGKTGWQHWETHKDKWIELAKSQGNNFIEFEPWIKTELEAKLIDPKAVGLRNYYFGTVELHRQWFEERLNESIDSLGERFNADDHVNVEVEKLFSVMVRSKEFIDDLMRQIKNVLDLSNFYSEELKYKTNPPEDFIKNLKGLFDQLNILCFENSYEKSFKIDTAIPVVSGLISSTKDLLTWLHDFEFSLSHPNKGAGLDKSSNERELGKIRTFINQVIRLKDELETLNAKLDLKHIQAEQQRFVIIEGKAGTGKSHLLAKIATSYVKQGKPAILLLGQKIGQGQLWPQVMQQLGLTMPSLDDFLKTLEAIGFHNNSRVLLIIDAINEGAGLSLWDNELTSLINKIQNFPHIACIISCRSEYFHYIKSQEKINTLPIIEITGFETDEEREQAMQVYMDKRGIARPTTPWLAPEFINPLFFRTLCVSLQQAGKTEIPPGLHGTKEILDFYLKIHADKIQFQKNITTSLVPEFTNCLKSIAGRMLCVRCDYISIRDCRDILANNFQSFGLSEDWLSIFLQNGLLRKDLSPEQQAPGNYNEVIRFSFQRFQDFLMAEQALEEVENPQDLFATNGKLSFCIKHKRILYAWNGLIFALSIVLPEKCKTELIDCLPSGSDALQNIWVVDEAFADSIKWRAHEAFTERTLELFNSDSDLFNSDSADVRKTILIQTAISCSHPWNAEFLHENLSKHSMAERDTMWTVWLNEQTERNTNVHTLIKWARLSQTQSTSPKHQRLAALTLCWFFTASNRAIRDESTRDC